MRIPTRFFLTHPLSSTRMGREQARLPWWAVPVFVVFFSGGFGETVFAAIPGKDVEKRTPTQAGEFLDSAALAILVGGSAPPTAAELAAQDTPKAPPAIAKPEADPLSGLLDGSYPSSDEESLRWKDAEETPSAELDPADGEIDPFSDGLSAPEASMNTDESLNSQNPAPGTDSPAN